MTTRCERCDNKGFTGRFGIYEMLIVEDVVGRLVLENADARTIKRAAQSLGMDTLRDDGARKVLKGLTTVEEVLSVTTAKEVAQSTGSSRDESRESKAGSPGGKALSSSLDPRPST